MCGSESVDHAQRPMHRFGWASRCTLRGVAMSVATVELEEAVEADGGLRAEVAAAARGLSDVDAGRVADPVLAGVWPGATPADLRLRAIETAAALVAQEPAYSRLAARLLTAHIAQEAALQ